MTTIGYTRNAERNNMLCVPLAAATFNIVKRSAHNLSFKACSTFNSRVTIFFRLQTVWRASQVGLLSLTHTDFPHSFL